MNLKSIIQQEIKKLLRETEAGDFDEYVRRIKAELKRLDVGEIIIKVIDKDFTGKASKYAESTWNNIETYFKRNWEKGFTPEQTAQYTRDKWYGV